MLSCEKRRKKTMKLERRHGDCVHGGRGLAIGRLWGVKKCNKGRRVRIMYLDINI